MPARLREATTTSSFARSRLPHLGPRASDLPARRPATRLTGQLLRRRSLAHRRRRARGRLNHISRRQQWLLDLRRVIRHRCPRRAPDSPSPTHQLPYACCSVVGDTPDSRPNPSRPGLRVGRIGAWNRSPVGVRATAGTFASRRGRAHHTRSGEGVVAASAADGDQLLHLPVALCVSNDSYREADRLGIDADRSPGRPVGLRRERQRRRGRRSARSGRDPREWGHA
jgi:hypothetical protein